MSSSILLVISVLCVAIQVLGFDVTRGDNLAVYWGQNSYGATHGSDTANWQKTLSTYCQDSTINIIPIAFLDVFFDTGGEPSIDLSNICSASSNGAFPGTDLAECQFLASDIQTCQAAGKAVLLSLGGASGAATFASDAQGQAFADTIWNLFLGGSSSTRPFGSAVLDGIDLDIEGGGSTGFAAFVTQLRTHTNGASKKYYVTGAPQCPFPDAYLGSVINAVGFDALFVQFYNNYCGVNNYGNSADWDFGTWDNWAKTTSPNKNIKIYIGAPASSTAAGSGYVSASTLGNIALSTRSQYSSFGGVMLWDASQAYANGRFDVAVKNVITTGASSPTTKTTSTTTTTSKTTTTTTTSTTSTTSTVGTGSCGTVSAWSPTATYVGGNEATYSGHLWTAKWWTYDDIPGGPAGVWTDDGACHGPLSGNIIPTHPTAARITPTPPTAAVATPTPPPDPLKASLESIVAPASAILSAAHAAATANEGEAELAPVKRSRFFKA